MNVTKHSRLRSLHTHHHSTVATMGAALSIPFMALPSMGTVCTLPEMTTMMLTASAALGSCRLVLRSGYLQCRVQFVREMR